MTKYQKVGDSESNFVRNTLIYIYIYLTHHGQSWYTSPPNIWRSEIQVCLIESGLGIAVLVITRKSYIASYIASYII